MLEGREKGFTLLEVLIAIFLLTLLAIPVFSYFGWGIRHEEITERKMTALCLAQDVMEEEIALGFDRVSSVSRRPVSGNSGFSVEVKVSPCGANMKRVNVTVYWEEFDRERKLELGTLLTER